MCGKQCIYFQMNTLRQRECSKTYEYDRVRRLHVVLIRRGEEPEVITRSEGKEELRVRKEEGNG